MDFLGGRFAFFGRVVSAVYWLIIGLFLFPLGIFATLSLIFTQHHYYQWILFLLVGAIFFSVSFFSFRKKFMSSLRYPSYKSFLLLKIKLSRYILFTAVYYLLTSFMLMILLGTTRGFGIKVFNDANEYMFIGNDGGYMMRNTGILLLMITLSLICMSAFLLEKGKFYFYKFCKEIEIRKNKFKTAAKW